MKKIFKNGYYFSIEVKITKQELTLFQKDSSEHESSITMTTETAKRIAEYILKEVKVENGG